MFVKITVAKYPKALITAYFLAISKTEPSVFLSKYAAPCIANINKLTSPIASGTGLKSVKKSPKYAPSLSIGTPTTALPTAQPKRIAGRTFPTQ